jgi:TPR repeat protein
LSATSPAIASLEVARLNNARASITAKHYHQGYAQFKRMADHGCPFSQCILGVMHQRGMGVKKNVSQAIYWFQKSAQQGFADAENRLGLLYYRGDGVPKNLVIAKKWLSRAAKHGVIEAEELVEKIPAVPGGESAADNAADNAAPQGIAWTMNNIRQAWQGYGDVIKQLDQITSGTQIQ